MKITLNKEEVRSAIEKYVRNDVMDYAFKNTYKFDVIVAFNAQVLIVKIEERKAEETIKV